MTNADFEALIAELAPVRKRHSVFVGSKSITYYESAEEAAAEAARLAALGYSDIRIRVTNW